MFKVMTLAKALDLHKLDIHAHLNCSGQILVQGRLVHCDSHHGNRAHGPVDAEKAIAKSCNVSAATWAMRIGHDEMVKYLEDLNLLKPTGVGLPFEAGGSFNYGEYAKTLQLATVGFGQSITATPLGLASAFCMLANHGKQMKPRLVAKVGNRVIPPVSTGQRVSVEAADTTMEIMESVIQDKSGTGFSLRIPGYVLAGKTGTAQRVNRKTGGGYISNFVGFVPAPNPKAMILVMINNPKAGAYYGAAVAGPVWENLAKSVIRRYHIPPNDTMASSQPRSKEPSDRHGDRAPVFTD
jgi:cell division protein FtsI/penicillin-binding protein 2